MFKDGLSRLISSASISLFSVIKRHFFNNVKFPLLALFLCSKVWEPFAGRGPNVERTTFWRAGIFINTIIQTRFSILRYIATISIILITKIAKYMHSLFNNTALM